MTRSTESLWRWEAPFIKQYARLASPIVAQALVASSLRIIDNIMIGRLGTLELAAVTQVNRYLLVLTLFLLGFAGGASVFISQYWGIDDIKSIRRTHAMSLFSALAAAFLFFIPAQAFPRAMLSIFLHDPQAMDLAVQYIRISSLNYLLMAVSTLFAICLRSTEQVRLPMLAGIAAIAANTLLNWLLIFGNLGMPALGIRGAAIAGVCAVAIECAILLAVTYRKNLPPAIRLADFTSVKLKEFLQYCRVSLPVVLNEGLWALGAALYGVVFGIMGTDTVAAFSIFGALEQVGMLFTAGLVSASSVMVGKAVGRGDERSAYLFGKRTLLSAACITAAMSLVMVALRHPIVSLYNINEAARAMALNVSLVAPCVLPLHALCWMLVVGVLRAGGDTVFSMWLDVLCIWLVALPFCYLAGVVWKLPLHFVYMIYNAELLIKIALGLPRFKSRRWINNLVKSG